MNKVVTLVLFLGVLLSATSQESKPTLLSLDAAVAAAFVAAEFVAAAVAAY